MQLAKRPFQYLQIWTNSQLVNQVFFFFFSIQPTDRPDDTRFPARPNFFLFGSTWDATNPNQLCVRVRVFVCVTSDEMIHGII